jgi:SAM-dependent methyltransferase
MTERILSPSSIPSDLWKNAASLRLSPHLARSYKLTLESTGLYQEALTASVHGDIGGETVEETAQHFTRNFSGSCGRVQLALLDPHSHLEEASNLFIRAFSGGKVGLLDIPCGAGAASAAILSAIATLRERDVIPRLPLDVYLVAGDFSPPARATAEQLLESLRPALARQAIFIHVRFVDWNVLDSQSTMALLHTWMEHARDCGEYFVLTANFSGLLKHGGKFKSALPQLEQVFGWAGLRKSSIVWLEPRNSGATGGLWLHFKEKLWNLLPVFFKIASTATAPEPLVSEAKLEHPLRPDSTHRVNLSLIKLIRNTP